jgi:hypothetical protein
MHCFYGAIALSAAAIAVGVMANTGHESQDILSLFGVCLALFAGATALFVASVRDSGAMHLGSLSVWLSLVFCAEFGVLPYIAALLGIEEADPALLRSLLLVIAGTMAFWIGTLLISRSSEITAFVPCTLHSESVRFRWIVGIFMVSILCKLILISSGVYLYTADQSKYEASLGYVQWLVVPSNFSFFAVIMLCIEAFRPDTRSRKMRWLIALAGLNLLFALLSGMKEEVLQVPLLMFVVWRLVRGRTNWVMIAALAFALIVLYPFNTYYRQLLREEGRGSGLSTAASLLGRSMDEMTQENSAYGWISDGLVSTVNRLDMLSTLHFLVNDQGSSDIKGDERLWMVPVYAFVPRYFWQSKPVLDKGRRLSIAMGAGEETSTAITPFGDLYLLGGVSAIAGGMLLLGSLMQWCTNHIQGPYDSKQLFVYVVLFRMCAKPELDMFYYCTAVVQYLLIALALGWMVYGGRLFSFSILSSADRQQELEAVSL